MTPKAPAPAGVIYHQKSAAAEGWSVLGGIALTIAGLGVLQWFTFPSIWDTDKLFVVLFLTIEAVVAGIAIWCALSHLRSGGVFECRLDQAVIACRCPRTWAGDSFSMVLADVDKVEREDWGDGEYRWYVWDRFGNRHRLTSNYDNPVDQIITALCDRNPAVKRVESQELAPYPSNTDAHDTRVPKPVAVADGNMELFAEVPLSSEETAPGLFQRSFPNIVALGIGLGVAYLLKWDTADLVWSLWLCSLVLGYLTILSALAGGAYIGLHVVRDTELEKHQRIGVVLIGFAVGLFFLGFFSLHFCGFHAGHSVFLNMFFPIAGLPKDGFGDAFVNPLLLWKMAFTHLMIPYGIFLVPAIIAERKHIFRPLIEAVGTVRSGASLEAPIKGPSTRDDKKNHPLGDAMTRPYVNVVRMHLLIFFFAFCHAMNVDSFLVYAVVYSVYFFPWSEVKNSGAKQHGPAS